MGGYLRALREARGGSLDDMARATRVGFHQLEALEGEQFAELPAPVFVKGFIRAYCHFLGEPADEALRRYQGVSGEKVVERRVAVMSRGPSRSASPLMLSLVLLLIFGFALLAVNLGLRRGTPKAPGPATVAKVERPSPSLASPAPATPVVPAEAPSAPVATPSVTPTAPIVAPTPAAAADNPPGQRLVVRAVEPTWIRVQADDGRIVEELLPLGATREWTAERRFLLTVGNAGGIEIELNGRPMPRLGERGAVIRQLELPKTAAAGS